MAAAYAHSFFDLQLACARRVAAVSGMAPRLHITLAEEGGQTRIRWRQRFDTAAECERLRALATPANEENLDRLEAELTRTA